MAAGWTSGGARLIAAGFTSRLSGASVYARWRAGTSANKQQEESKMSKWISIAASLAVATVAMLPGTVAAQQAAHEHAFAAAKDLKWNDTPALPGAKLAVIEGPLNEAKPFILRIKFPADYKIPPHFHSAIEHVTVISGEFIMGLGEKFEQGKGTALKPGDVGIMQAKTPHYAYAKQATEVQVHGIGPWTLTFVNPNDDPRKK
jgi:hypothetical protein